MQNVLLEDWVIDECRRALGIGGAVTCSNFTVKNSVFSAAPVPGSMAMRLSGEGKALELKRMMLDNVLFDGFSIGLKVGRDVLIGDAVRIISSEFGGAKHDLETLRAKVTIDGIARA
jgi:hypothetical protein